jgi:hypothetical protein
MPRESRRAKDPRLDFKIDVKVPSLRAMSTVAWRAIQANNDPPRYFSTGSGIVRIVGGVDGIPTSAQELTIDSLTGVSARTALWHKFEEKKGEIEQFPLEKVMRDMLSNPNPPLPRLVRITRAPAYGPNLSLSVKPGFDHETGHYFAAEGLEITEPPLLPDEAQVSQAKQLLLEDFLVDFPFVGPADRAHALSLMLNPFVRSMIDGPTPLYMIEAPSAGTGKSLLAHLLMLPGTGIEPAMISPANNDEEMRKTITANLARMPEAVLLDNVSKEMKFPSLASVLTARVWTDRVLGRSEVTSFPVQCTWIATGNNPTMTREIYRRTIRIRLDAQAERPEERTSFRHTRIERWARERRADLITACLTLINHWIAHGALPGPGVLGSYDDWAGVHSGILESCGVDGFLDRRSDDEAIVSSDEGQIRALVLAWWEEKRSNWVSASELLPIALKVEGFYLGNSPSDRAMTISLGMQLAANRDRIVGRHQIKFRRQHGAGQYALIEVPEPVPF